MSLRDNPLGELKVPLTWTAAVALIVAAVVAVAILLSDRRETFQADAYGATRSVSDRVFEPVGEVLSAPGRWIGAGVSSVRGYFFAASENRRLKAELKEMRQWRDVAIALRDTNERYRTLLGLRTDPPIPMVAARVVTDSRGPFANARLANAGREKGVKIGNPVMSENGLVGRVIGVTDGVSRVLLLTDVASRTPVMIDRTNARAILTGDGGPNPRLDYMRGREPVRDGDRVLTSGDGGLFPRGLPVGTAVKGLDGRWRVVLAADRAAVDFVRILLFEDFTQLTDYQDLARMKAPPPTLGNPAADVPEVEAAVPSEPARPPSATPARSTVPAPRTSSPPAAATTPVRSAPARAQNSESRTSVATPPVQAPRPPPAAPPVRASPTERTRPETQPTSSGGAR